MTLAGLYLYRSYWKVWLLVLSFGTLPHLIKNEMGLEPRILPWPLHGFAFQRIDLTYWILGIFHALLTNPVVYIPELIDVVLFIWFTRYWSQDMSPCLYLKKGQVVRLS